MDVVKCRIVEVGGRRYRVQGGFLASDEAAGKKEVIYDEESPQGQQLCPEGEQDKSIIKENDYFLKKISADKEVKSRSILYSWIWATGSV